MLAIEAIIGQDGMARLPKRYRKWYSEVSRKRDYDSVL